MGRERREYSYPLQLPLVSALGALEVRVYETAHPLTLPVTLHLAGESSTLGAEVVIALDEIAFEVANLENLHRLERTPELVRPRHLHHDTATWKERGFSLANLERANCSSVETLTA